MPRMDHPEFSILNVFSALVKSQGQIFLCPFPLLEKTPSKTVFYKTQKGNSAVQQ